VLCRGRIRHSLIRVGLERICALAMEDCGRAARLKHLT